MQERGRSISRALFWVAAALFLLSAYELAVRLDAMWGPLKMFVNMAIGERIPLSRVWTYVDITVFYVPLYMLGCAALALWGLICRRTRRACGCMLAPAVALAALGFTLRLTLFGEWTRTLKLLPLVLFAVLCALRAFLPPARRPRQQEPAPVPPPGQVVRHRRMDRRKAS